MKPEEILIHSFVQLHPIEAAQNLELLDPQEAAAIMVDLPDEDIAKVLGCCLPAYVATILVLLPPAQVGRLIHELPASTALTVFRQMEPAFQKEVLEHLGPILGPRFRRALFYPKQTAGSLADPRVLTLSPDITVDRGLQLLKRHQQQATYYLYVVDRDAKLEGVITMKQMIVADRQDFIGSVMNDKVMTLRADLTNDELIGHPHWQIFHTLPVVDHEHVFLGALRYRVIQKLIEETILRKVPGSLPHALVQLWEAYAFAGIRVLTELSQAVGQQPQVSTQEKDGGEDHT